jgi:hypothetical protein
MNSPSHFLICPDCHTQLPLRARFCRFCGVRVLKKGTSDWLWPTIIIVSALAAGLVNFVFTDGVLRPIIVLWFLFACPGMALVRFLRIKEPMAEWTLVLALSFVVVGIVASLQLYAGMWSIAGTLIIVMALSVCGATVQLVAGTIALSRLLSAVHSRVASIFARAKPIALSLPRLLYTVRFRRTGVLLPGLFTLLISILVGASLWSFTVSHGSASVTSNLILPQKTTSHPNPTAMVVPTPTATSFVHIAELYNGTVYNIPAAVSTEMSLQGVRQTQVTISGTFSGLQKIGMFNGSIDPSKHIHFLVKDSDGRFLFSFEGDIHSDGEISGNYCDVDQHARCMSQYGLWSVAPA